MTLIDACAQRGAPYAAEFRVRAPDGTTRWILSRGRFDRDESGYPFRARGIVIDITPGQVSERAYVTGEVSPKDHPLERAADHCLAAHRTLAESGDSCLKLLSEMMLLELGRKLATLNASQRRGCLN